jgi:hypothetical protein
MLVVVVVIDETTMRMLVVGWLCGWSRWILMLMGESEFVTLYKIFSPYHDMKICSSMMNKYFWWSFLCCPNKGKCGLCSLLVRLCTIFFCDHCDCFFVESYLCFLLGLLTSSSFLNQFLYQSNLQSLCWLLTLGCLLLLLIINGAGNYRVNSLYCKY